ncbi:MAG: TRAP transporter large permease subunit, partial [Pseudomonadota bacterium]
MELELILAIAMFLSVIAGLLAGYPVALTLGGVALIFGLIGIQLELISLPFLRTYPGRILGSMENQTLIAVPLFVLMGVILERSKVAEDLLHTASRLLAGIRGGLGYAVVIVGALLAASTGIVGATVVTMTLIALPTMLRQGYDPK